MIVRDVSNSRMKDFFDCYQILTTKEMEESLLYDAICATFDNRGLEYDANLQLFTADFATDNDRHLRWNAFLKKIQWKEPIEFADVMKLISERLRPMYERYWRK